MKTFVDSAGRTWTICIHVTAIKRLRGFLDIDLYSLIDNKFEGLGKLLSDPVKLVDVIYVLCKEEADKLGVSDEDFGRSMWGDGIGRASEAFLNEYVDFFQDAKIREGITRVLDTSRQVRDLMINKGLREMDQLDLEQVASKVLNLNGSSGNSEVRSESTPDHSRSTS